MYKIAGGVASKEVSRVRNMAVTLHPTNTTNVTVSAKLGSPKKRAPPLDTSSWLTRNEASDLLGCSVQTLLKKERADKLHPVKALRVIRGREQSLYVYDPKELAKLPRRNDSIDNPGERAARAYEKFDEGLTDREVVTELRETPDWVHDMRSKWMDGGGADLVITPDAKLELERVIGSFAGVADLVAAVQKLGAARAQRAVIAHGSASIVASEPSATTPDEPRKDD